MLLRTVQITDPASPYHGKVVDLRITDGGVEAIADRLEPSPNEAVHSWPNARLAPGFVDIGAYLGDPGHEEREDVESLTDAARAGGYVAVATLPNTDPVRQTVADVHYLATRSASAPLRLLPLAALSQDTAGRDLTAMMELAEAGALAFTDGPEHPAGASLLKRGLEYARGFNGILIDTPFDERLVPEGQMHEGEVSVSLGLRGIPEISETIPLRRSLSILAYSGGQLILHLVSAGESVDIIRQHRREDGLRGCTVGAHHLTFTADDLEHFDPNFKLLPPLRETSDREALRRAVMDGTVDAIVSDHRARHREEKDLEFTYAAYGARGLETAFRQQLVWAGEYDALDQVVAAFTSGPRRLLGLPPLSVQEGATAEFTLFRTDGSTPFTRADLRGKTANSPLLGRELPGSIIGTIYNDRLWTSA